MLSHVLYHILISFKSSLTLICFLKPMSEINKKRKATDQLSPYSQEPEDEITANYEQNVPVATFKKAKARKDTTISNPSLKGIFTSVSLTSDSPMEIFKETTIKEDTKPITTIKDELIAGLNASLFKCIDKILKKQANKDLSYVFQQYFKFLKDFEENTK